MNDHQEWHGRLGVWRDH